MGNELARDKVVGLDDGKGSGYFVEDLDLITPWILPAPPLRHPTVVARETKATCLGKPAVEAKREQGKATDLEALRELAQQRGYKRGWAERVYQARLAKRHSMV
jgi:hypothetical protein